MHTLFSDLEAVAGWDESSGLSSDGTAPARTERATATATATATEPTAAMRSVAVDASSLRHSAPAPPLKPSEDPQVTSRLYQQQQQIPLQQPFSNPIVAQNTIVAASVPVTFTDKSPQPSTMGGEAPPVKAVQAWGAHPPRSVRHE